MNFKNQLKGLTALIMVLGCMFFFNSCEDPIEDPCLLRDCGSGTCVESASALDGYFCNCDEGFVNNASDSRCTECAEGFFGANCDSTSPCDDVDFSCPTGASCVVDTMANTTSCVCDVAGAVLSADTTVNACVCPEGLILNADSTACIELDARAKFVGIYSQSDVSCDDGSEFLDVATVVVSLDPDNANQIILKDFANIAGGHDVLASVNGDNFSIISDTYTNLTGAAVMFSMADEFASGSFNINDNDKKVLAVTYSSMSGASSNTCTAVLTEF